MRGNPFVPEFAKTLGTSLEDQSLFRPIMTLLIATYRSFCVYKTSSKNFKYRSLGSRHYFNNVKILIIMIYTLEINAF